MQITFSASSQVECLHVGLDFVFIIAKRKSFVMQERASGLGLGWDRSFFVGEDCVGLGAIDFGVVFPLDLPLVFGRLTFSLRAFPFTLLTFLGLVLFSLALTILPFRFFPCTHGLIPLGILGLGLHWASTL